MQIIYAICAGLDVHQASVTVCLKWRDASGKGHQDVRTFATMTTSLLTMRDWLLEHGCRVAALESTGPYWRPIWNVLAEASFELFLVNPSQLKRAPGRKTDVEDSVWLADRLEVGALEGSYVPDQTIWDARELTRYRRRLVQEHTSEANRLQKILESANIKLAVVASDILGVTGRALLKALIAGQPVTVETMAKGRLRAKMAELEEAMTGRVRPHHRMLLGEIMAHLEYLEAAIARCDAEIAQLFAPYTAIIALLCTTPGIQQRSAEDLLAEIGVDMSHFPTHQQFCAWAALCPGNKESGGKRLSGKTRKGNPWLRAILVECAISAKRTRKSYLAHLYQRLMGKKGKLRAAVAVAHSILTSVYYIVRDAVAYEEPATTMSEEQRQRRIRHHTKELEGMGLTVQVAPTPTAA
jgi:transposase